MTRDELGRVVREAWVEWALTQPNPRPSWLVPWDELNETDREADRCIGEAVATAVQRWIPVAECRPQAYLTVAANCSGVVLAAWIDCDGSWQTEDLHAMPLLVTEWQPLPSPPLDQRG